MQKAAQTTCLWRKGCFHFFRNICIYRQNKTEPDALLWIRDCVSDKALRQSLPKGYIGFATGVPLSAKAAEKCMG